MARSRLTVFDTSVARTSPADCSVLLADGMVVVGGLGLEERREFLETATAVIHEASKRSAQRVLLDCSQVEYLDEGTLGMLVTVARAAQRRGARVALAGVPANVAAQLDTAGVSHFFD